MAEKTVPAATEAEAKHSREELQGEEAYLRPPVDIYETKEGLVVVADLPGVERDQVRIDVDNGVLTIDGKTKHSAPGNSVWSEYKLLNFHRRFELPEQVDPEKITADLKHGVLRITLPKAEAAKPKKVNVKVG